MSPRSRQSETLREIEQLRNRNAALKECLADALSLYHSRAATVSSWARWAQIARGLIRPHDSTTQTTGDTP